MITVCVWVQVDWAVNIRRDWDFTEEGAHARLDAFLQDGETLLKHEHIYDSSRHFSYFTVAECTQPMFSNTKVSWLQMR